ncbi:MAG: phage integrase SAM-like domain-containing protein, partial [Endomicrobium sp.]|nr:phage integrase SAM-like domain-containing protein [Endomicrobium sp.]
MSIFLWICRKIKRLFFREEKALKVFFVEYVRWYYANHRKTSGLNVELITHSFLKYLKNCKTIDGETVTYLSDVNSLHIENFKTYKRKLNETIANSTLNSNVSVIRMAFKKIITPDALFSGLKLIRVDSDKMAYYGINPSLIAGALELESLAGYGGEIVSGDL